jgi:hypothetical protein
MLETELALVDVAEWPQLSSPGHHIHK